MSSISTPVKPAPRLWPVLAVILLLGAAYTWLDFRQPAEPVYTLLAFLPGGISFLALLAWQRRAGIRETYLQCRPLSLKGGLALLAATVLLLPILGSSTGFTGWQWLPALVYAPASGIAQELYFRVSLLPAFEHLTGKKWLALVLHGILFIAWHLRILAGIGFQPIALVVIAVLFTAGIIWGWQVQRDRTVVWAVLQHSLYLVIMSLFNFG